MSRKDLREEGLLEDYLLAEDTTSLTISSSTKSWREIQIPGYEIVRKVGHGSKSVILLAHQIDKEIEVVIKILFLDHYNKSLLNRFIKEFDIISELNHPGIISIYERAFAGNFAYIAMDYLPNGDLKSRIKQQVSESDALTYMEQMIESISIIHDKNIVHRDLKPNNILFDIENNPVITDFGISSESHNLGNLDEVILGTPNFMSPEQCEGKAIDKRSDIYSLGVIFYQLLTSKRLFPLQSITKIIDAHINTPIPVLPKKLRRYQPIMAGLLAKDRNDRFQNMAEVSYAFKLIT